MIRKGFCFCLCFCLFIFFVSCQASPSTPQETTYNYPGLTWGMSPDQVIEALGLDKDSISQGTLESGDTYIEYEPKEEVFGKIPGIIALMFSEEKDELCMMKILYPGRTEETIQTIKSALEEQYGPLEDEVVIAVSPELSEDSSPLVTHSNKGSKDLFYWVGKQTLKEALTPQQAEQYQKNYSERNAYWKNESAWEQLLCNTHLSMITFNAQEQNPHDLSYPEGACFITFNGSFSFLAQYMQEEIDHSVSSVS